MIGSNFEVCLLRYQNVILAQKETDYITNINLNEFLWNFNIELFANINWNITINI